MIDNSSVPGRLKGPEEQLFIMSWDWADKEEEVEEANGSEAPTARLHQEWQWSRNRHYTGWN